MDAAAACGISAVGCWAGGARCRRGKPGADSVAFAGPLASRHETVGDRPGSPVGLSVSPVGTGTCSSVLNEEGYIPFLCTPYGCTPYGCGPCRIDHSVPVFSNLSSKVSNSDRSAEERSRPRRRCRRLEAESGLRWVGPRSARPGITMFAEASRFAEYLLSLPSVALSDPGFSTGPGSLCEICCLSTETKCVLDVSSPEARLRLRSTAC